MGFASLSYSQISGQSVLYDHDLRGNEVKRYVYYSSNKRGHESQNKGGIALYPNPSKEFITIKLDSTSTITDYQIFTIDGRLVKDFSFSLSNTITINVYEYANGVYIILPNTAEFYSSNYAKFTIQR